MAMTRATLMPATPTAPQLRDRKILELLMRNPKRVWSRDQLLEQIWGIDFVGDTKTVDVHIRWLREKIETTPSSPDHIRTVRGFGYRFG